MRQMGSECKQAIKQCDLKSSYKQSLKFLITFYSQHAKVTSGHSKAGRRRSAGKHRLPRSCIVILCFQVGIQVAFTTTLCQ